MKIKQALEDFRVEEVVKLPKKKEGDCTYFWLTKTNYTTVRALQQIARAVRASPKRFHFAGTKDKNGITKQLISALHIPEEQLKNVNLKDIELDVLHTGSERVNLGFHTRNRFEIVVRDLEDVDEKGLKKKGKFFEENGIPNYFDEQRFSTNNVRIGCALLRGEIKNAVEIILSVDKDAESLVNAKNWSELAYYYDKHNSAERTIALWLIKQGNDYAGALRSLHKKVRMMYVHSYQSYLFNKALSSIIKPLSSIEICGEQFNVGKVRKLELKLPGYETKLSTSAYDKKIAELLKSDGVSLSEFKLPRTPELSTSGSTRSSVIFPYKLKIEKAEEDELNARKKKIRISFELDKGAYATLFVRILFA